MYDKLWDIPGLELVIPAGLRFYLVNIAKNKKKIWKISGKKNNLNITKNLQVKISSRIIYFIITNFNLN